MAQRDVRFASRCSCIMPVCMNSKPPRASDLVRRGRSIALDGRPDRNRWSLLVPGSHGTLACRFSGVRDVDRHGLRLILG